MRRPSLQDFLTSGQRSLDVYYTAPNGTRFKCYVRRSRRVIGGHVFSQVLDLANFGIKSPTRAQMNNVDKPEMMAGTGAFRNFIDTFCGIAQANDMDGVYIENVLNVTLPSKLPQYGFTRLPTREPGEPPSFWRPCK